MHDSHRLMPRYVTHPKTECAGRANQEPVLSADVEFLRCEFFIKTGFLSLSKNFQDEAPGTVCTLHFLMTSRTTQIASFLMFLRVYISIKRRKIAFEFYEMENSPVLLTA